MLLLVSVYIPPETDLSSPECAQLMKVREPGTLFSVGPIRSSALVNIDSVLPPDVTKFYMGQSDRMVKCQ